MRYPVTITPDDGQFTVTFPDVPEAVTFGHTRDEALRRSADALLTIFDALMKDRRDIPPPSETSADAVELPALETTKIELYRAMRAGNVGKAELAKRLQWHLPQVDRVLHVRHGSQLDQMEAAFAALGKKLVITVVDESKTRPKLGRRSGFTAKRGRKASLDVHPGVLVRQVQPVRNHAAKGFAAGRLGTAKKPAKKR